MPQEIRVWDFGIRLFHWSLVALFAIAYVSGDDSDTLHNGAGYIIIGLLAFRLLWGLVGGRHARFSDFIYAPRQILAYLKGLAGGHPRRYLGHNPAGGLMIVVMLLVLFAVSWTGLKADQASREVVAVPTVITFGVPEARADDDGDRDRNEGFWEEAHEASVDAMLALIVLHLAGVAASSLMHRENLVRAMLTGRKRRGEA